MRGVYRKSGHLIGRMNRQIFKLNTTVRFRTLEIEHFDFRTLHWEHLEHNFCRKNSVLNRTLIKLIRTHRTYFSNTWKCPKVVAMR